MINAIVVVQGTLEFHKVANNSMNVAIYNVLDWTDFRCLVMKTGMLYFVRVVRVVPQSLSIRSNKFAISGVCCCCYFW